MRHHTDCESVAKCIVKKRAKARKLRKGVDRVLALAAQLHVEVVPVWVSGNAMMLQGCDSGSRSGGLGVFATNAPPAASFLPASTVRDLWTAPLGDYLRMRFGIRFVAFQPAGWSLANLQRRDVAFAPSAALSRRCIVDLLDEIRCDEYRLGATVVLIGGAPSDWLGGGSPSTSRCRSASAMACLVAAMARRAPSGSSTARRAYLRRRAGCNG